MKRVICFVVLVLCGTPFVSAQQGQIPACVVSQQCHCGYAHHAKRGECWCRAGFHGGRAPVAFRVKPKHVEFGVTRRTNVVFPVDRGGAKSAQGAEVQSALNAPASPMAVPLDPTLPQGSMDPNVNQGGGPDDLPQGGVVAVNLPPSTADPNVVLGTQQPSDTAGPDLLHGENKAVPEDDPAQVPNDGSPLLGPGLDDDCDDHDQPADETEDPLFINPSVEVPQCPYPVGFGKFILVPCPEE